MQINDLPTIMIRCLLCTIIIEIIVGIILKIKDKKDLINIVLVNILTNPLVVSLPIYVLYKYGIYYKNIIFILLEFLTLFIEGYIYKKSLKYNKINPFIISLILNGSSYYLGEIINKFL